MRRPLWLCNAHTIEARTGVPAVACMPLAWRAALRIYYLDAVAIHLIVFAMAWWLWWPLLGEWFSRVAPLWFGPVLGFALPALLGSVVYAGLYIRRLYRLLDRFNAEPWCLKCRYPVPAAQASADTICPECGDPIPPEIANLAAEMTQRAEQTQDRRVGRCGAAVA